MNHVPRWYLVCYDICDDARLRKVWRLTKGYGERLQYSVYRCLLTPKRRAELISALEALMKPSEDSAMLVQLGDADHMENGRVTSIGRPVASIVRVVKFL